MLYLLLISFLIIPTVLVAKPMRVIFDFDSNNGVSSQNTFPASVKISSVSIGGDTPPNTNTFKDKVAMLAAREPNHTISFVVDIDKDVKLSLDEMKFDFGFIDDFSVNKITPYWTLKISKGYSEPLSGSLPTITRTQKIVENQKLKLKGLKDLSGTQVTFLLTFLLTFHTAEKRHAGLTRSHIIDNIMLSGSVADDKSRGTLLAVGGISIQLE